MTATATTAPRTAAKDSFLRFALRLDAALTGLAGVANGVFAAQIAEMAGTTTALEYGMSAFFIGYAIVVYLLSRMRSLRVPGLVVIAANVLYTVGSVLFVVAGFYPLTTFGIVVTLATGVYTLVMADLQYIGLRRL